MDWYFKVQIFGDEWVIYLVDDDDEVIAEKDSAAETDPEKHEIHFREGEITMSVIMHELWHAYFSYTNTDTANLDNNQMEEVSAQVFAYNAIKMTEQAKNIHNRLIEIRDNKENT